ncbi:transcriptional regulator [Corallococcus sp. H22C18031201]|uniref:cytochrome c biogenesis protein n=1 Tax=Citreicoccus inhibens TaxID=2849499 RepID=UPI000E713E29|nr:cytochrome c biogenesis protein CcsA [Citreicoccus inhibens]MBU8900177.1 cytochrome c biogenesis protein CcsA [Citreicoccus inhibens]RJS16347.1 transcriptional regulator [Corallococcus sp. H22C18031201]
MGKLLHRVLPGVAVVLLVAGAYLGLFWAPPDREMGDVQRIMYVHVPAVWMALLALTLNFCCSVTYLFKPSWKTDAMAEASAEVGLLFGTVGVLLGSIWGRPTWGVYWTWDPRITTAAIMLVAYVGYLALRRFVEDPEKRAVWSAVVGIIAAVDVPIVWFSVRWWRSLHQVQSSPKTVDPLMVLPLRVSAFAFLALMIVFLARRYLIALAERNAEVALPEALPSDDPATRGGSGASKVVA